MNKLPKILFASIAASMLYSPFALSAEYRIGALFSPTLLYDDNVLLRQNKQSSFFTRVSPTLQLGRYQENSSISMDLGYRIERYASLSDLDREDPFVNFATNYATERSTYGLTASYAQNAQRDIAEEDTGDFSSNATVTTRSIAPSYQYQLSERDFVYANLSYSERTYSSSGSNLGQINNFSDNETWSTTGGWFRNLSERLTGGIALSYVTYESESELIQSDYDSYNVNLTSSYAITERWSVDGAVGYRYTKSETQFGSLLKRTDSSTGTLFDVSLSYAGELDTFTADVSRSLQPSGEGIVNETDRLGLSWTRQYTERVSLSVSGSYQESTSVDQTSRTDRKFYTFSPTLKWQVQEQLSLDFGYQYRKQTGNIVGNSNNSDDVDSNMVFVTINYDWDGIRFSR